MSISKPNSISSFIIYLKIDFSRCSMLYSISALQLSCRKLVGFLSLRFQSSSFSLRRIPAKYFTFYFMCNTFGRIWFLERNCCKLDRTGQDENAIMTTLLILFVVISHDSLNIDKTKLRNSIIFLWIFFFVFKFTGRNADKNIEETYKLQILIGKKCNEE